MLLSVPLFPLVALALFANAQASTSVWGISASLPESGPLWHRAPLGLRMLGGRLGSEG